MSRLHEQGQLSRLYDKLVSHSFYIPFTIIELLDHMSFDFFIPNGGTRETQVLEDSVCRLKNKGWAKSTSGTYRTHFKNYLEFCGKYDLEPVPCTTKTVELYIAFLFDVKKLAFSSIRSYVNIISVLHKSHDVPDPIASCWNIRHLLTGVKRELGTSQDCKAPITLELLLKYQF